MADEIATLISSVGLTQDTFLVFCVLALLVVGAVVVIITSRPILDIYPYLNPSARVRARKGRLFDDKQISELVETSNVEEVENYLKLEQLMLRYCQKFQCLVKIQIIKLYGIESMKNFLCSLISSLISLKKIYNTQNKKNIEY